MDFSTPSLDLIKHDLKNAQVVNSDQVLYNSILWNRVYWAGCHPGKI